MKLFRVGVEVSWGGDGMLTVDGTDLIQLAVYADDPVEAMAKANQSSSGIVRGAREVENFTSLTQNEILEKFGITVIH